MRLKKDGTPAKKPGRKPGPPKPPGPGKYGLRPHVWVTGPDPFKHDMYHPWQLAKAQANFREEGWTITFDEYYNIWKDYWHQRGRKGDDYCLTRITASLPWTLSNVEIITRREFLQRQGLIRKGATYKKRKPKGSYSKMKKGN